jgi:hypothetical protein
MNENVNMNYRFLWNSEPSDEQLNTIMKEVGEDVRREHEEIKKKVIENIQLAATQLLATQQTF